MVAEQRMVDVVFLKQYSLSLYHVSGTMFDTGETSQNKTDFLKEFAVGCGGTDSFKNLSTYTTCQAYSKCQVYKREQHKLNNHTHRYYWPCSMLWWRSQPRRLLLLRWLHRGLLPVGGLGKAAFE